MVKDSDVPVAKKLKVSGQPAVGRRNLALLFFLIDGGPPPFDQSVDAVGKRKHANDRALAGVLST